MSSITTILSRSLAAPFYRRNAGLFAFLVFILFGLQPNFKETLEFHYIILEGVTSSLSFFLIALSVWLVFMLKTLHFFNGCNNNKSYHFLQLLNGVAPRTRYTHVLVLQLQLLLPVLLYGLAAFVIGLLNGHLPGAAAVLLVLLAICATSTFMTCYLLRKTRQSIFNVPLPSFRLPTGLFSFLVKYIFREQFIVLILLKLVTFSALYFFARIDAQVFEDRMLWLIYLTVLSAHSILVYRNQHFMETKLSFYRNMPARTMSTLLSLFGLYALILIPEIWALKGVAIQQHEIINYCWMVLTGPSLLLLLHCLLYTEDMKMEGFLQLLFGVWVVTIFFSLSANRWLMPLICLGMAVFVFNNSYRKYEKNAEVEALE